MQVPIAAFNPSMGPRYLSCQNCKGWRSFTYPYCIQLDALWRDMALPAPSRRIALNACCFGPSVLFTFEQDKDRLHAKSTGIAIVGIGLCA